MVSGAEDVRVCVSITSSALQRGGVLSFVPFLCPNITGKVLWHALSLAHTHTHTHTPLSYISTTKPTWCSVSFNLLRIKGLYMFRPLLARLRESLHRRNLVYWVRIMSVGCGTVEVIIRAQYTKCLIYNIFVSNLMSLIAVILFNTSLHVSGVPCPSSGDSIHSDSVMGRPTTPTYRTP
jgi:hypothetical protein